MKLTKCAHCDKETGNPKFCSRSCSATYSNTRRPPLLQGQCDFCSKAITKSRKYCSVRCRRQNQPKKLTHAQIQKRYRSSIKRRAVKYKGGKCVICDYDRCLRALEFHHLDPKEKDFQISRANGISWDKMTKELDKCILVCCRCHREIHEGLHHGTGLSVPKVSDLTKKIPKQHAGLVFNG